MKLKLLTLSIFLLFVNGSLNAQKTIEINQEFDKLIVSPHIEASFKKGATPSIVIEEISVPMEKFRYEIENGTLQLYLEGAKTYTKNKKVVIRNQERKAPLYKNRVVKLTITYKDVSAFSLRGEEKMTFQTPLIQENCTFSIYGKSEVIINEIEVTNLKTTIYGDSFLRMEKGTAQKQKITAYGASKVMASGIFSEDIKLTAYGSGTFQLNASNRIKVTSYGEATVLYKGTATLKKGIVIGESIIKKVQ